MTVASIISTFAASLIAVIITAVLTYVFTRKREIEADWRKLKLEQYKEFVLALSGIVRERATPEAQRRYADAVNGMSLVASEPVLLALHAFQDEISCRNPSRNEAKHDELLNQLFHAMRADIQPAKSKQEGPHTFRLLGLPPSDANGPNQ